MSTGSSTSTSHHGPVLLREASSIFPKPPVAQYSFLLSAPRGRHRVNIRHPAYEPDDDLLLTLYALDHEDGGIHHGLLHTICAIVSGNHIDGFLSESRDATPIVAGIDEVLRAGEYFFHVPLQDAESTSEAPYRYPIVPTFLDWKFPTTLPKAFARVTMSERAFYTAAQSTVTGAVRTRDISCRMSAHQTGTEAAHLCPEHEKGWFLRNAMQRWNSDLSLDPDRLLWDMANLTLLRSDLHTAFDDRKFIFFPKSDDGFHIHMLEPAPDITALYHNVPLHDLCQGSLQFLYTRLAWAIFPSLAGFLSKPNTTRILLIAKEDSSGTKWVEAEMNASAMLRAKVAAARSQSPKKRSRADEMCDCDEVIHCSKRQRREEPTRLGIESAPETYYDEGSKAGLQNVVTDDLMHNCNDSVSSDLSLHNFSPTSSMNASTLTPRFSRDEHLEEGCSTSSNHDNSKEKDSDSLASAELEQDLKFKQRWFPNFDDDADHDKPSSWYPGWREISRLKRNWLARTRPKNYIQIENTARNIS